MAYERYRLSHSSIPEPFTISGAAIPLPNRSVFLNPNRAEPQPTVTPLIRVIDSGLQWLPADNASPDRLSVAQQQTMDDEGSASEEEEMMASEFGAVLVPPGIAHLITCTFEALFCFAPQSLDFIFL